MLERPSGAGVTVRAGVTVAAAVTVAAGVVEGAGVTEGLGLTALMGAAARAVESNRSDPLFRDPLAECFVRAAVPPIRFPLHIDDLPEGDDDSVWGRGGRYLALRTRVFDDLIQRAVDGGVCQVVMLGAGLDTRVFRLPWPSGCTAYEVDRPAVHAFKREVLARAGATPSVRHVYVSVEHEEDWPARLRATGFDPGRPTVWTAEGVLPYLSADAERTLLSAVAGASVPGSRIGYDMVVDPGSEAVRRSPVLADTGEKVGVALDDLFSRDARPDSVRELRTSGWSLSVRTPFEFAARYGRGPRPGTRDTVAHARWITGERL